jgi:hypothetical protein
MPAGNGALLILHSSESPPQFFLLPASVLHRAHLELFSAWAASGNILHPNVALFVPEHLEGVDRQARLYLQPGGAWYSYLQLEPEFTVGGGYTVVYIVNRGPARL